MMEAEAAEHIYLMYRRAKKTGRRLPKSPFVISGVLYDTRRATAMGIGKEKSRGFCFTHDDVMVYAKGKGKWPLVKHFWQRTR